MYRADLVRSSKAFYPNPSPHADTSACFEHLRNSSFGFVYQVLCYERIHAATQTSKSKEVERYASAYLSDLIHYGPFYLSKGELDRRVQKLLKGYHRFLAVNYFVGFRSKAFWDYHRSRLEELGYPVSRFSLFRAGLSAFLEEALNPGQLIKKLRKRIRPESTKLAVPAAPPNTGNLETSRNVSKDPESPELARGTRS
jgi:hypothetical protein